MRAIFTLVKDLLFLVSLLCLDLKLDIQLPAITMEDNSAVITINSIPEEVLALLIQIYFI